MSRHHASRRRNYARRQHQLHERPKRWQMVVRQWEMEHDNDISFARPDEQWRPADYEGQPK
jgi:hypothetical protein